MVLGESACRAAGGARGREQKGRAKLVTSVWALVTALLVQLFVDGGRRLVQRRQAHRARAAVA